MPQTGVSQRTVANATVQSDSQDTASAKLLSKALGEPVTHLERIGGGFNSKVYRVTCGDSATYAAKFYFHHPVEDRRRLDAEYSGLRFMWDNGLRCIPKPIVSDRKNGFGVYEYLEGEKILHDGVSGFDVDSAVDFLVKLKELRYRENSGDLPSAAEACFSVQAIVDNISFRFDRLNSIGKDSPGYRTLRPFLIDEFAPTFEAVTGWCEENLRSAGLPFDAELPVASRTLSPSDFGFHNSLKRKDSENVFLDFEYFGWDDPAKMISDFLLHPGYVLDEELKRRFTGKIIHAFADSPGLAQRLEAVYPLFGLKWCMIILNAFLPEQALRRGFVGQSQEEEAQVQAKQMEKARTMLDTISRTYQRFSYND